MEKTISALDARRRLGELLEEVYYKGNQFIVERAGKPMAAVVPIKHYRQWRKKRDELFAVIDEVRQRNQDTPSEEIEAKVAEAVREAREDRRGSASS